MGPSTDSSGYKLYNPMTGKFRITRTAVFFDKQLPKIAHLFSEGEKIASFQKIVKELRNLECGDLVDSDYESSSDSSDSEKEEEDESDDSSNSYSSESSDSEESKQESSNNTSREKSVDFDDESDESASEPLKTRKESQQKGLDVSEDDTCVFEGTIIDEELSFHPDISFFFPTGAGNSKGIERIPKPKKHGDVRSGTEGKSDSIQRTPIFAPTVSSPKITTTYRNVLTGRGKDEDSVGSNTEGKLDNIQRIHVTPAPSISSLQTLTKDDLVEVDGVVLLNMEAYPDEMSETQFKAMVAEKIKWNTAKWLPSKDVLLTANQVTALLAKVKSDIVIPQNLKQARTSPQAPQWDGACLRELESMKQYGVFVLVPGPVGSNKFRIVPTRWVFDVKLDPEGSVSRYKARFVAKGFRQVYGLDYDETFAAVVHMPSLRVIIAIAAQENLELEQLDVDVAFLNGQIDKDIYIQQPPGYEDPDYPDWVWKLNKSLYGLKQACKIWNETVNKALYDIGFVALHADPCVYILSKGRGERLIVAMHVDDFLMAGKKSHIDEFKSEFRKRFNIKDIGQAKKILGIEIGRPRTGGYTISQRSYVREFVEQAGMKDAHGAAVPLASGGVKELLDMDPNLVHYLHSPTHYQHLVGKMMYAATGTRPDISYALSLLGRYNSKPSEESLTLAKHVIRYLSSHWNACLVFKYNPEGMVEDGYADSNFVESTLDGRSHSGHVIRLNGTPVAWHSGVQDLVTLSMAKAEYVEATQATLTVVWLRNIFSELGYDRKGPTILYDDN